MITMNFILIIKYQNIIWKRRLASSGAKIKFGLEAILEARLFLHDLLRTTLLPYFIIIKIYIWDSRCKKHMPLSEQKHNDANGIEFATPFNMDNCCGHFFYY
ncbi:hypothetical protein ACJX0J_031493 [Zea mays]